MAVVTFVSHDGEKYEALGRRAVLDAGCGQQRGARHRRRLWREAACGTCHVIVAPEWSDTVGLCGANEEEMLAMNPERQRTSRLSCQMSASEAWDGLTVELPEFQL